MTYTRKLANLTLSVLLTLFAGMSIADDTEIYIGDASTSSGTILPNILFILDTSSSMTNMDGGTETRLDRMKEALRQIISTSNNVNMGLMRFHKNGGPVLYPVKDINMAAGDVDGEDAGNLSFTVSASEDDAEEKSGVVTLTNTNLFLTHRAGTSGTVSVRVSTGNDDAEERVSSGAMSRGSTDLEITDDGSNRQMIGMRFQNITIPQGADVTAAALTFEVDETKSISDPLTVKVWGEAEDTAGGFGSGALDISGRSDTTAFIHWEIPTGLSVNDIFSTIDTTLAGSYDFSDVVEEITDRGGWGSGNDMAFFIEHVSGSGIRTAESNNGESSSAPLLTAAWSTGVGTTQTVGVRFRNINIPQGATITNAYLEFGAASSGTGATTLTIQGEDTDDADAFTTDASNISGRTTTTESVTTQYGSDWVSTSRYQSDDMTAIVQGLVNRSGWCGGNAMAFILTSSTDTNRIAWSYDGNPSEAPVLKIEYDEDTVPDGACINQTLQAQVISGNDDAEEAADGSIDISSSDLEMVQESSTQTIGIRFRNIQIPKDTTILEAHITFTTDETPTNSTSLTITGEDVDNSDEFSTTTDNITNRLSNNPTSATASWSSIPTWSTTNEQHRSPDVRDIVAEITTRAGWESGNAMTFLISGTGKRVAHSYDGVPSGSPILTIKVQGKLGTGYLTVRDQLTEIVDNLNYKTGTPILDTMYEAANYWRGGEVYYGRTRGQGNTLDPSVSTSRSQYTRVSRDSSYTGGTLVQPAGCTDDNPNSTACINEYISGNPVYTTPVTEWCQANYQILLSDGYGYGTQSVSMTNSLVGSDYNCSGHDNCSTKLVEFMHNEDQLTGVGFEEDQTVKTYTIGFNFSGDFLRDMATLGGGEFREASSADELAAVFQAFIADILSHSTSFTAPAVSVNVFNKLYHDNEIYFSEFLPKREKRWPGNLKKYKICTQEMITAGSCSTAGEILDANNSPAVTSSGFFNTSSRSIWSSSVDGNVVEAGGAGMEVPVHTSRTIYTYTGSSTPTNTALGTADHMISETDEDALVGDAIRTLLDGDALSDADYSDLVYWVLGKDINDEDEDGDTTDERWKIGSSLHAKPLTVTFGKDGNDGINKIFLATNTGSIQMINTHSGIEEWSFIPQTMLDKQKELMTNAEGDLIYGLDSDITRWVKDVDDDGVIEPSAGDKVYIFFGMRRGGRNIYAMDVTPASTLTSKSSTSGITPTLKWRIIGGTTTGFDNLGQTWSPPKPATIKWNGASKNVLIFGGGYHPDQDTQFGTSSYGNAIYIVDMETGALLWWASSDTGANLALSDMDYPIPSEVTVMDSNFDGYTDRIYVGDTGGQLWRIDLGTNLTSVSGSGGVLANVSSSSPVSENRKFFYPPDVALIDDSTYSSTQEYDMVTIASGDRANPTETSVHDQVYAFRDTATTLSPGSITTLTQSDLYDATLNLIQESDGTINTTQLATLKAANGWYINLNNPSWNGEKGLSKTIILEGVLLFSTYAPGEQAGTNQCVAPVEGSGKFYAVNLLNAGAVYPAWDGTSSNYTRDDRNYDTNLPGIPPDPIIVFLPNDSGGTTGYTFVGPQGVGSKDYSAKKLYWHQEKD